MELTPEEMIALLDEQAEETARVLRENDPDEARNILWNQMSALISKYEALKLKKLNG